MVLTGSESSIKRNRSGRRRTLLRRCMNTMLALLGVVIIETLWRTCRIRVVGEQGLRAAIAAHQAVVPVCWHQHLLLCSRYWVSRPIAGMQVGFLNSPSVDGDAATTVAHIYGGHVVRGSSSYDGARALRQLYKLVVREHISLLITPDGPRGPRFQFKGGAILAAQLCGVPLVPLAYAARSAHMFKTWDKFIFPRPFTRVVLAVGQPVWVPRQLEPEHAEALQQEMAMAMHATYQLAKAELERTA